MPRARKGAARRQARNRILKQAKGYWGGRSRLYRTAKEAVTRAGVYAFRDRKRRKRDFRRLWIVRIGAAARQRGLSYSQLMSGLRKANAALDRKTLADLAVNDQAAFDEIAAMAKQAIA